MTKVESTQKKIQNEKIKVYINRNQVSRLLQSKFEEYLYKIYICVQCKANNNLIRTACWGTCIYIYIYMWIES